MSATFRYDPFGGRIYKSSSSGTSIYAYDLDNLIEETNSAGTAVARYSQGLNIDEPLAMLRSATTSYYQADGLGSVTSLTNAAGAAAQTYTYDSFGNTVATSGSLVNSFQYTGREFDTETSLYYYRARYYDLATGRFLSEDPLRFFAGEVDFYSYAEENPTNLTDPLGLLCRCSYSQSTGHLVCFDIFTGMRYVDAFGYAGYGDGTLVPGIQGPMPNGQNNPDWNDVPNLGPLPRGNYGIGQTVDRPKTTGPMTILLTFQNGTTDPWPKKRGKNSMRIHGDSDKHPGKASEGCIIMKSGVRRSITDNCGPGSTLAVGP